MKNRLSVAVTIILLMAATAAQAQFSYGAKLGIGFPQLRDDDIGSQRITLSVGFAGGLKISDVFQLVADVGFQRKGNKFDNPFTETNADSTYVLKTNLDYINIPLCLKVNLGRSSKFYFQAGGYYGYLVHANFTGKLGEKMVKRENIIDGLERSDYGIVLGGGIETPIRPGFGVVLDVKYQIGMRDINKDPQVLGHTDPIRNKGLVMSMGFYIDIE